MHVTWGFPQARADQGTKVTHKTIMLNYIIIIIAFMQGVDNNITETNHVPRVYSVAAVLYLQFVLHVMLFCLRTMFRTFTLANYYYHYYIPLNVDTYTFLQSAGR
jgi:hypothetical protein